MSLETQVSEHSDSTTHVLQPYSLAMAIAGKLRERILLHKLPPGNEINEGALAQEFGVSRTPVREALKLLCHEGLLTAHVRRGMTVTQLSAPQIKEAQEICSLLQTQLLRPKPQCARDHSRELTWRLFQLAKARLQLALGPSACPEYNDDTSITFDPSKSNLQPE